MFRGVCLLRSSKRRGTATPRRLNGRGKPYCEASKPKASSCRISKLWFLHPLKTMTRTLLIQGKNRMVHLLRPRMATVTEGTASKWLTSSPIVWVT